MKIGLRKTLSAATLAAALISGAAIDASAGESQVKVIMRELASKTANIAQAVAIEDFAAIGENAMAVAEHEKPGMDERSRIIKALGERSIGFMEADEKTHHAALLMAEAAKRKDMDAVLEGYVDMLSGCVECHANYRDEVRKLFNEAAK